MALDAFTWLYSGNPLETDRNEVRWYCGDTLADDPQLGDAEVDGAIQLALQMGAPINVNTTISTSPEIVSIADTLPLSASTLAVNGSHAAGVSVINLDATTLKGSVRPGDVLLIAGHAARYTVMNIVTASSNALASVEIWPGLVASAADNAAAYVRLFNVKEAAALCCDHLARRYAREVDESVDGRSRQKSQKVKNYQSLAAELRAQAARSRPGGIGIPVYRT